MIINYDRNCSFMVLDTVITIVNCDCHMFIVQATGHFAGQDVLNRDPTAWLDGARPPPKVHMRV